jgi:hypothetical protein
MQIITLAENESLIMFVFCLFIYCIPFRSRIFHLYGDVTIAGEGLQNLGLCWAPRVFELGGSLSCHTYFDTGLGFTGLIRRAAPFSRHLRHTRGCGEPILTQILRGPHVVASLISYDTQGNVDDIF